MDTSNFEKLELEAFSNFVSPDIIAKGVGDTVQGLGQIASAVKKSDPKAQVEAICGKQPHGTLGFKSKKKKQEIDNWNNCVKKNSENNFSLQEKQMMQQAFSEEQKTLTEQEKSKSKKNTIIWVGVALVGVVILTVTSLIIYKRATRSV